MNSPMTSKDGSIAMDSYWFPGTGVGFPEAFSEAWLEGSLEDVDVRNNKVMEVVC